MVRKLICTEDEFLPHGLFLQEGALLLPEEKIPIVLNWEFNQNVGWAREFKREDHEITAELKVFGFDDQRELYKTLYGIDPYDLYHPTLYCQPVHTTKQGDLPVAITSAKIRCVSLIPHAMLPTGRLNAI